jgi:hypothetical protein
MDANIKISGVKVLYGVFIFDLKSGSYIRKYRSKSIKPQKVVCVEYDTSSCLDYYELSIQSGRVTTNWRNIKDDRYGKFIILTSHMDIFDTPIQINGHDFDKPISVEKKEDCKYQIKYKSGHESLVNYHGNEEERCKKNWLMLSSVRYINKHKSEIFIIKDKLYNKTDSTCCICKNLIAMKDLEIMECGCWFHLECILQKKDDNINDDEIKCPYC